MKTILLIVLANCLFAQPRLSPNIEPPSKSVSAQSAQEITIKLSADLVTALEKSRRDDQVALTDQTTGVTIVRPSTVDLKSYIMYMLSKQGGLFRSVLAKYPPSSIKVAQEAAREAIKKANEAADEALKQVK